MFSEHKKRNTQYVYIFFLRYECETCQKRFVRKNHYELHKTIHLKPHYTCNMCSKNFRKKNRLAAHWKKTHQQEIFDFGMLFSVDTVHKL